MKSIFDKVSAKCSRTTTFNYSTSFTLGILLMHRDLRAPIFSIYGFVRFADEIVDSFQGYDRATLLEEFKKDTYKGIEQGISLNPIINSFQHIVNRYDIDHALIETFFRSMEMDLYDLSYDDDRYKEYILGSAEVVGLMCLKVFTNGDKDQYNKLSKYAMTLGSAFQKINFLRDLNADYIGLGRTYFPGVDITQFDDETKRKIETEIAEEFEYAYEGIMKLDKKARFGVFLAYRYYSKLLKKVKKTKANKMLQTRIRIPNQHKYSLLVTSYVKHKLNVV